MNFKEVRKLLNKKVFPHKVKYLKLRETYISWLIFTGNFVYKIKKPVKFSYLDFSSLSKRKFFLEEELKLNRRLSKEIYLDVAPIIERKGELKILESSPLLKGEKIIEHALKMKEIPEKYYAPELLKKGKLRKNSIRKIAKIVADFHKLSQTSPEINKYGAIKIIKKNCEENFRQTKPFLGRVLNETVYKFIAGETRNFIKENKRLFLKRQREEKIRDCHGDLYTENIFIAPQKIYIIDCIEFNKRFRYQDIASDAAFLAMDFDYLGKPDFSKYFIRQYNAEFNDKDLFKILPFYKCYRAYIRAKVGCFSLPAVALAKAGLLQDNVSSIQKYFSLAFKYAHGFSKRKPFLLIICGQIGAGKTYLARHLSKITGAPLLLSDAIRKEMLGIPLYEHRKKGLEKIYSHRMTVRVYKKMLSDGLELLKQDQSVILDATFPTEFYRNIVIEAAEKEKILYFFVECRASEDKIIERLKKRRKKKEISDATLNIYLQMREKFDKIKLPKEHYVLIDTEKNNVDEKANKVLKRVLNLPWRF
ncbi:AAA family ATPase [Patescibacteria group bacterium]|nr:AAA family ATPase [Patescibacteria group bacterium]MBU4480806.1 AAA family ATPase [Patescibacteria group bacterium]